MQIRGNPFLRQIGLWQTLKLVPQLKRAFCGLIYINHHCHLEVAPLENVEIQRQWIVPQKKRAFFFVFSIIVVFKSTVVSYFWV